MSMTTYLIISIIAFIAILALLFVHRGQAQRQLTPLGSIAFILVITGVIFGNDRLIGYGLMGVGVVLAVYEIVRQRKAKPQNTPPAQTPMP
ncbi:MAG: hypothetical protein V1907_02110 [Candidatus Kerfeldbacteria bacterium]